MLNPYENLKSQFDIIVENPFVASAMTISNRIELAHLHEEYEDNNVFSADPALVEVKGVSIKSVKMGRALFVELFSKPKNSTGEPQPSGFNVTTAKNWVFNFTDENLNLTDLPNITLRHSHIERLMKKHKYPLKTHYGEYGHEVEHVNILLKDALKEVMLLFFSQSDLHDLYHDKVEMDNLSGEYYRNKALKERRKKKGKK